jgi:hypothetical protein
MRKAPKPSEKAVSRDAPTTRIGHTSFKNHFILTCPRCLKTHLLLSTHHLYRPLTISPFSPPQQPDCEPSSAYKKNRPNSLSSSKPTFQQQTPHSSYRPIAAVPDQSTPQLLPNLSQEQPWSPSIAMAPMKNSKNNLHSSSYGEAVVRQANVLASCYVVSPSASLKGFHYCTTLAAGAEWYS